MIEVDDEVFNYLKSKAEPLVDTSNTVLRRELLGSRIGRTQRVPRTTSNAHDGGPNIPAGTPMALREILEVVHCVRNSGSARTDATHNVARKLGITPQSVIDKYTRQLGLTASQFDRLLDRDKLAELRTMLKQRFQSHVEVIDHILG